VAFNTSVSKEGKENMLQHRVGASQYGQGNKKYKQKKNITSAC